MSGTDWQVGSEEEKKARIRKKKEEARRFASSLC